MIMAYLVKAFLNKGNTFPTEIRRFSVDTILLASYQELHQIISEKFPRLTDEKFVLQWKDEDGDSVALTSDDELKDAVTFMKDNTFKVYVQEIDERAENHLPRKEKLSKCQDEEFAPPPQFRRWMRRFMRRWHTKVIEQDEESCNRLLDNDLIKLGAKNQGESSEESGVSSGERKIVKDQKRKKIAERQRKIFTAMQRKVQKCKMEKEPDEKKVSESDMSPKPEKKKKQIRIVITPNDDKESTDPKFHLQIEKSNGKERKARKEIAEDVSSGPELNPDSPITETKRKQKPVKINKIEKSDESGWTVLEEDAEIIMSGEKDDTQLKTDSKTIQASLSKMLEMGFTNEGGWLFHLLLSMDGNIVKAVDTIKRNKKTAKTLKHATLQE